MTETAYLHRKHSYNLMFWSNSETLAETDANVEWTRSSWNALKPLLVEDSYQNYLSDEGEASARAAYGPNYERLGSEEQLRPKQFLPDEPQHQANGAVAPDVISGKGGRSSRNRHSHPGRNA